jgi:hypothetical protein
MACTAILPIKKMDQEIDIFSNKSSLILFWLLVYHDTAKKEGFSVNAIARNTEVSVGLAYKVIRQLEYIGVISSKGFRTNKKFYLIYPDKLLISWIKEYNLIKKTKTRGFGKTDTNQQKIIRQSDLVPALHNASEVLFNLKITNLHLQEFYLLAWDKLPKITAKLHLQELDRGYEILFIKPYYSALLTRININYQNEFLIRAYTLLTIMDLCHFPIRGIEQAESLFRKSDFIKSICLWSSIENAIG